MFGPPTILSGPPKWGAKANSGGPKNISALCAGCTNLTNPL